MWNADRIMRFEQGLLERIQELRPTCVVPQRRYRSSDVCTECYTVAVSTSFTALAARLFLRLLAIVRSMTAPQLIHFHA
jgi:hypothetical protein